ncbi:hypothetical protein OK016_00025 [Vibrio chagasii]|nr:hypothetical protein [Vibrio chagasii]
MVKDPTAATTTINDDSDVTRSLSADASVTEGENITYTATLGRNPADGAVTVTLSNGATIPAIADGATRNHDGSSK